MTHIPLPPASYIQNPLTELTLNQIVKTQKLQQSTSQSEIVKANMRLRL